MPFTLGCYYTTVDLATQGTAGEWQSLQDHELADFSSNTQIGPSELQLLRKVPLSGDRLPQTARVPLSVGWHEPA